MRKLFVKVIIILHYIIDPVSSYQVPMLQQYHKLPQLLDRVEKSKPLKIGAAAIAAHGMTDLFTKSPSYLTLGYVSGFTLTYISPVDLRYIWLVLGSTYHFSKDMIGPFKLIQSLCLHEVFIEKPRWVYLYLLCFHMPLHYWRFFTVPGNIKYIPLCILFTWLIYKLPLHKFKSIYLFPVIGHIMVN